MKKTEVIALLKANQDERGAKHWNNMPAKDSKLKSFGIGLTKLRKMAKQIGKDHELATQLWKSDIYDARIISLLIDDPKMITQNQVEQQVDQLSDGHLAHVFSTCGAPLARAPFAGELADKWMVSKGAIRRRCGFGLLHEMSKSTNKNAPDDSYFLERIEHIKKSFDGERPAVQLSMGQAIMGIGSRDKKLHTAALEVARKISPIHFDPTGKCEPFDVVKNLTSDYIKQKLGV